MSEPPTKKSRVHTGQFNQKRGLDLQLLGGCSLELDGCALTDVAYEKLRALLIFLALEKGNCFQRDWLAEMLWPDLDPEAGKQNLRRALSNLRQLLGEDKETPRFLLATRSTVAFAPHEEIRSDVDGFLVSEDNADIEAIESLIALYRGEFLAGFSLAACPTFDSWCEEKREVIRRRYAGGLAFLQRRSEEQGNIAEAIGYANRLVDLDVWDEAAAARLMRLYARAENVKAALSVYERCRRALSEDLGLKPGEALCELAEQLQRREASCLTGSVSSQGKASRQNTCWGWVLHCHWEAPSVDTAARASWSRREMERRLAARGLQFSAPYSVGLLIYFQGDESVNSALGEALEIAEGIARQIAREAGTEVTCVLHADEAASDWLSDGNGQLFGSVLALRAFAEPGEILLSAAARSVLTDDFFCECLDWNSPLARHGLFPLFRWHGRRQDGVGQGKSLSRNNHQLLLAGMQTGSQCIEKALHGV